MPLTVLILFITRSVPDQRDGCQLLLIPKDNGPWIDCSREGTNLKISCKDMAGAAIGLDVLLTKGHCGPIVEELSVFVKGRYNETSSSNASRITKATKQELQRCFEHCIQSGLRCVRLTVKSISQVLGIFPSNMDTVDLRIQFIETPMESELNDWVSSFSSVCVKGLGFAAACFDYRVDLEDLCCVLQKNANLLHIKSVLRILNSRVSAKRVIGWAKLKLPYHVRVSFMKVCGIGNFSTLNSLLTCGCLRNSTLSFEPGFQDSLTEEECREILEMKEVHTCLKASPSVCNLLTSLLRRVTVCNKPLYWPDLKVVKDVEYVASNILPIIQRKNEAAANGIELCVDIKDDDLLKKMLELIQTTGMYHYEPDETSMRRFFLPATGRDVREHCGYHVFNR